jgi:hypothetical protein
MLQTSVTISIHALIALLAGCAMQPVVVQPVSDGHYTLLYYKAPIDSVPHMREALTGAAEEVCNGAYTAKREYPNPTVVPSRTLRWDIECG